VINEDQMSLMEENMGSTKGVGLTLA